MPASANTEQLVREISVELRRWRRLFEGELRSDSERCAADVTRIRRIVNAELFARLCAQRGIAVPEHGLAGFADPGRTATGQLISRPILPEESEDRVPTVVAAGAMRTIVQRIRNGVGPFSHARLPIELLAWVDEKLSGWCPAPEDATSRRRRRRRAGRHGLGVHYTPERLIREIVGRVVRRLALQAESASPRIVDPACGGGLFLLEAFRQFLHQEARRTGTPARHVPARQRMRIVRESLFGIELDAQAVVVARQTLFLAVLASTPRVSSADADSLLPALLQTLAENIVCADALTVMDSTNGANAETRTAHRSPRLGHPGHASTAGAFDAVVTNPPFGSYSGRERIDGMRFTSSHSRNGRIAHCAPDGVTPDDAQAAGTSSQDRREPSASGWPSRHEAFVRLAFRLSRRLVGLVLPEQVAHLAGYAPLRKFVTDSGRLLYVGYWGEGVFRDAVTPIVTIVAEKNSRGPTSIRRQDGHIRRTVLRQARPWVAGSPFRRLLRRIEQGAFSLGTLVADCGVHTGNCAERLLLELDAATAVDMRDEDRGSQASEDQPMDDDAYHGASSDRRRRRGDVFRQLSVATGGKMVSAVPILEGRQVDRYRCERPERLLRTDYTPQQGEYFRIAPESRFRSARFLIRQTATWPIVGPRRHAVFFRNSLLALFEPSDCDIHYLVGILNSRLMRFVYRQTVSESRQRTFPQVKVNSLRALPMRRLDLARSEQRQLHDRLVRQVRQMLRLQRKEQSAGSGAVRNRLRRTIQRLDRRIDHTVYTIYGLTAQEAALVDAETG